MSRFAQGTNPEYIKKVNEALYGEGHDASIKGDETVREELLEEAAEIGPDGGVTTTTTTGNTTTTTGTTGNTLTAGFGDNKMIIYLVVGGALLWYLNKEGYLKKILK